MALFKNALLALLASIAFFWVTATEERQKIYIRGLNCNCSDKFIKPGYKCYAKSYNRSFSTFNLIGTTKMPVYNLSAIARLFYRYGNIYREVLHTPFVDDVCGLLKLMNSSNPLLRLMIDVSNEIAPGFLHECPYTGVNVRDVYIRTDTFPHICPSGDYKYVFEGFFRKEFLLTASTFVTCTSALRENFGK